MAVFQHSLEINLLHSKVSISSILLSLSTDLWCPWMVNLQDLSLNSATLSSTLLLTVIPMTWSAIKYGQQLTRLFFLNLETRTLFSPNPVVKLENKTHVDSSKWLHQIHHPYKVYMVFLLRSHEAFIQEMTSMCTYVASSATSYQFLWIKERTHQNWHCKLLLRDAI